MSKFQDTSPTCSRCGATLPPNAPEGLCPRCVMALNLSTETDVQGVETGGNKPPPQPPLPPAEIGKLFPQLEILETLGRGGMGAVYKARQPRLDRFVALKILSPEKQGDPKFAERFEREAQTLARLKHPNIVTIHDFGEVQGNFYLLMEFVDGLTLRQLLQKRKLSAEEALAIVPKICEALQYAHQQGIVHRDIKPENILLDQQGQVKIADFGIAKIVGQQAQLGLTQEKQVIGTPHYMSPEQVEKPATVDHRSDIYSLGVVFYEMLTGELPLGKFAAPSQKVQVDVRLDEVVLHALEKEPERRYQHASVLKTDVESIANTPASPQSTADSPAVAQRRHGLQMKSGTFFFVAVCFLIGGMSFGSVGSGIGALFSAIAMLGFAIAGVRYFCAAAALDTTPGPPVSALEKEPERHYQQASVFKTDVETIATTWPNQPSTHGRKNMQTNNKSLWIGLAIGAACLIGLAVWLFIPHGDPAQLTQEGWQLWQERKMNEAADKFNEAVKLDPKDANAWNGLGWATFNSGKPQEAEKAFQKAVSLEPNHPAALNGLGQIYLSQKKYDRAETYLLKAAPNAPAAWYGLARLYLLQGKFSEAEEYAQKVVDSGQGDEFATKMLQAAKEKRLSDGFRVMIEPK